MPRWKSLRATTVLWQRLFDWLTAAFDDPGLARSMFLWANLSVTLGGSVHGTRASHEDGMVRCVAPLIEASSARVIAATNEPTRIAVDRWAGAANAARVRIDDLNAWLLNIRDHNVLAAKVGHPSRGVSRIDFVRRIRALVNAASEA